MPKKKYLPGRKEGKYLSHQYCLVPSSMTLCMYLAMVIRCLKHLWPVLSLIADPIQYGNRSLKHHSLPLFCSLLVIVYLLVVGVAQVMLLLISCVLVMMVVGLKLVTYPNRVLSAVVCMYRNVMHSF